MALTRNIVAIAKPSGFGRLNCDERVTSRANSMKRPRSHKQGCEDSALSVLKIFEAEIASCIMVDNAAITVGL
jgi:hypothetical protein